MRKEDGIDVSIVIVCMNNVNDLFPCLDGIILHNHNVRYIITVVAYLFSRENLDLLAKKYPMIEIIESNEIRGFSENNNLALKQAKGEFCFILNDDTAMNMPVIDLLVESIRKTHDAAIMSPKILFPDGRLQYCGRPKIDFWTYILSCFYLWNERHVRSSYTNKKGIFQTYNISGSAFLVKTRVLKELGCFDETFFFCPEDIALSTLANMRGYKCYVDESITLYHIGGGSYSKTQLATLPALAKGNILFHSNNSVIKKVILTLAVSMSSILKTTYFHIKSIGGNNLASIKKQSHANTLRAIYSSSSTKEIFLRYYKK